MARVEHYRGLDTEIDSLYNSIRQELEMEKNLKNCFRDKRTNEWKTLRNTDF